MTNTQIEIWKKEIKDMLVDMKYDLTEECDDEYRYEVERIIDLLSKV